MSLDNYEGFGRNWESVRRSDYCYKGNDGRVYNPHYRFVYAVKNKLYSMPYKIEQLNDYLVGIDIAGTIFPKYDSYPVVRRDEIASGLEDINRRLGSDKNFVTVAQDGLYLPTKWEIENFACFFECKVAFWVMDAGQVLVAVGNEHWIQFEKPAEDTAAFLFPVVHPDEIKIFFGVDRKGRQRNIRDVCQMLECEIPVGNLKNSEICNVGPEDIRAICDVYERIWLIEEMKRDYENRK